MLGAPDAGKRPLRIGIEQILPARGIEGRKSARKKERVSNREIEALGASGRDDMGRVAGKKKPAIAHRLGNEAPHPDHSLLEDRSFHEAKIGTGDAAMKLGPDAILRPGV